MLSLTLGVAVLLVNHAAARVIEAREHPVNALTDDAAVAQVVEAAVDVATTAGLQRAGGGYAFVSCKNSTDPPYQVAVHLTFPLPPVDPAAHLDDVAAAMVADGWSEGAAPAEHFGRKLTRDGLTAIVYRNPERTDLATMRLYGQCRVTSEHRHDDPVWTEITERLPRPS